MSLCQNLANSLASIRTIRQLSISEFSEELCLARSTTQDLLSGTGNPRMDTVEQIAAQLHVEPLSLLSASEKDYPPFLSVLLSRLDQFSQRPQKQQEEIIALSLKLISTWEGTA